MKQLIALASLIFIAFTLSAQYNQTLSEGKSYSNPLQIDSSEYYVIGTMVNKTSRCKYSFDQQYQYNYLNLWTDVKIYNSTTKESKKLFSTTPISINPVMGSYIYNGYN